MRDKTRDNLRRAWRRAQQAEYRIGRANYEKKRPYYIKWKQAEWELREVESQTWEGMKKAFDKCSLAKNKYYDYCNQSKGR